MSISQWFVNFTVKRRLKKAADKAFLEMMDIEEGLRYKCMCREYDETVIFFNCPHCESKGIVVPFKEIEDYLMTDIMIQCDKCRHDIFPKRAFTSYFNNRKIYQQWKHSPFNPINKEVM